MKNAIGGQANKYQSRDRDSRNKKYGGQSFTSAQMNDPMQAIQNQYQINKTTSNESVDPSRNLMLNNSLEYKSNKDALMKNVKKQNQKLLQQQMQMDTEFN